MGSICTFPSRSSEGSPAVGEAREAICVARCERRVLTGIRSVFRGESDTHRTSVALAHVIDQLAAGERIEFRYGGGADSGSFSLAVDVETVASTATEADRRIAALSTLLDAALDLACPHLHFLGNGAQVREHGSIEHVQEVRPAWWVLQPPDGRSRQLRIDEPDLALLPGGLMSDDVGAERAVAAEQRAILLDQPPNGTRFPADLLAKLLGRLPQPHEVVLRFENVVLSSRDRGTLRNAATRLAYCPNQRWRGSDPSISQFADQEEVQGRLNAWLARGRGCRCRCFVVTQWPGIGEHAAMLGHLVFGQPIDEGRRQQSSDALDLRGAVPSALPVIYPFPTAATSSSFGLPRTVPSPKGLETGDGVRIGHTDDGQAVSFGEADRLRHTYVIGATGTGKSTLLLNMIRQDMAAGKGVIVIDPHGDLFADARRLVPPRRLSDLVLLDFADFDRPVAMNILKLHGSHREIAENFVCNELIRIFARVLYRGVPEAFGPVFETYFRNALLLLLQGGGEGVALVDLERVFADDGFREELIGRCAGKPVADFWRGIASKVTHQDHALKNMAPYIVSKLTQFTSNALIRPIIAQPGSIDFRQLMDDGRIVLVNLAKGLLGELDSALLGMLVLGKIYLAALSRADTALASRRVVHLFVDEFQNIASESLGAMMSEARKFGLCATLANQSLSQIDGRGRGIDVAGAVLANAANLLVFRVGIPDAERLACWMQPSVTASMLAQLADFHVAARLLRGGRPLPPFLFQSEPGR